MRSHGQCRNRVRTPEYQSWICMKTRCLNPNSAAYRIYGARGIGIDPSWMDFAIFLRDMGKRPSLDYSLERIDNSKGYGPTNCKWATRMEQGANRRTNHFITFNGLTLMLNDWARKTGIHRRTISSRLKMGWPTEIALSLKPSFANNISDL